MSDALTKMRSPAKSGQTFTNTEDRRILAQRVPDVQLSRELHRSVGSIRQRRYVLRERGF